MGDKATKTPREVAEMLGVHPNTVYRAVEAGEFPIVPIRIGRKLLFATSQVERLLDAHQGD